jgi:PAS domain S-box-containing protein
VGLKTDITERKEALDKLIQSEERYRMLFESAPVGIMYCSHDGSLLDFNAALTAVFETLESQSREKINVFDFSPFAHAGIAEACREAITGDHSVYREHEYRPLPARPLILRFVVTPTHDLSGRVNGAHTLIEDFTERRNAEIRLSRSLTEKETLLKEIHHRVKNNLQTVSSLLTLQAEKVEEDRARSALLDSVTRVNSMSMIHERLYGATDQREVRFDEYLAELVEHLLTLGVPTPLEPEVELEVAACLLDIDTAVPLSLVANELISNALKHAFAAVEEPRLIVRLSASAETLQLVIGDNGPGVPTSDGSAPPAGLGLQLVDALVKQVRGTLTRESTAGHTVMVTVPLPPGREQDSEHHGG